MCCHPGASRFYWGARPSLAPRACARRSGCGHNVDVDSSPQEPADVGSHSLKGSSDRWSFGCDEYCTVQRMEPRWTRPWAGMPNWFARPNPFIRCFRWPITSFWTSKWATAERQPHMRLGGCGSSRATRIRSPSPCQAPHYAPPPPPVMFRCLRRSQCHTLPARCSSTSFFAPPPNALSSVGALVPCTAPTLALDLSQASVYCTALGSDIFPRRHVDPHGMIHGEVLVCICEWCVCRW